MINIFIKKFFKIIIKRIKNRKLIEAIDWIKKYFNDASEEKRLLEFEIKGINLNKLISKPIQHPNQEFDEIVNNVLKNKKKKNSIFEELLTIKI